MTPHQVRAQANEQSPHEVRNVISANPFLLIATWFNGEYERKVSLSSTLGLRVSTLSLDIDDSIDDDVDADYYSGRIFWRYYPRAAFRGFFFGLGAGLTSVEETGETHSALGAGFDLGYSWLLGRRDNFYISLGAGADRLFGGDLGGASAVIPTFRIVNIGFAF
ncbi:MAG: DUF3575 domain-containing protein [Longimicrobiales bacterium]